MINTITQKRSTVAKFLVLALFMMFSMAFVSNKGISTNSATGTPTTEASKTKDNNDINDLKVSISDDGSVSVEGFDDTGDSTSIWQKIFDKYKIVIAGISGIATLTFVVIFIFNFVKVGAASDVPAARKAALSGCLWTGIAAALCGSVLVITALFWNGLK